jgi:ribonuclease P protein component
MLARPNRLTKAVDFRLVGRRGKTVAISAIRLRFIPSGEPISKFGVVVPSRVSKKATVRNLLRRRIQARLRHFSADIRPGYWAVITVQPGAQHLTFTDIQQVIERALKTARLL